MRSPHQRALQTADGFQCERDVTIPRDAHSRSFRMSKTRCTIQVLFLCVFTAVVSYAQAEAVATGGEVLLRLRPTEAGTYPMRVEQAQSTTIDLGPMGEQEILADMVLDGRFKVTPLGGGGLVMEMVYDRFMMKMSQMGQETVIDSSAAGDTPEAQALQKMTGKPITLQLDDTGRVLSVSGFAAEFLESGRPDGAEDPQTAGLTQMMEQAFSDDSMSALLQQSQTIYPQEAVGVGDTWTSAFDVSNAAIGAISAESHYKLVEMTKYRGRDAARLDVVMDMNEDRRRHADDRTDEHDVRSAGRFDGYRIRRV